MGCKSSDEAPYLIPGPSIAESVPITVPHGSHQGNPTPAADSDRQPFGSAPSYPSELANLPLLPGLLEEFRSLRQPSESHTERERQQQRQEAAAQDDYVLVEEGEEISLRQFRAQFQRQRRRLNRATEFANHPPSSVPANPRFSGQGHARIPSGRNSVYNYPFQVPPYSGDGEYPSHFSSRRNPSRLLLSPVSSPEPDPAPRLSRSQPVVGSENEVLR